MDFKESLQVIKTKMENDTLKPKAIALDINAICMQPKNYTKPYNASEEEALAKGFEEVEDDSAYNGRYFVKDGLIWIHNIEALKSKLGVYDEDELRYMKYDVDTYYNKNSSSKTKSKKLRMYDEKENTGIDYGYNNMVYLSDGVYIHKDDCWW